MTRAEDVRVALDRTVETFARLDVAFNNAGVEQPIMAAADITEEVWGRIIDVNLRGVFLCMRYQIPLMLEREGGAIVNTSSGAGVKGFAGQAAYAAAKHGVIGLSKSAVLDYAQSNLRINVVAPGIIDTAMMDADPEAERLRSDGEDQRPAEEAVHKERSRRHGRLGRRHHLLRPLGESGPIPRGLRVFEWAGQAGNSTPALKCCNGPVCCS